MTVYSRDAGTWKKRVLGEGETYVTPELPGFELPLKKLLQVMDAYGDDPVV